jgi:fatty acid desaturase
MQAYADPYRKYRLTGSGLEETALDNNAMEQRVERKWFSADLPRKHLKQLMQRSDAKGLANFGPWVILLVVSGYGAFISWGTWWAVPAFFIYGTLYTSSDAHWHECAHGTAFRSYWLNELFYHPLSFMCLREAYLWRWSHARHHTHTIMPGRDPEIAVPRPARLLPLVFDLLYVFSGWFEVKRIFLHACGVVTPEAKTFVPQGELQKMFWSSRAYVAIAVAFAGWSIAIGSFLPIMFVVLPRFYGAWLHHICALTQHCGLAEGIADHRLNTRTVYMNPVVRFYYANMNYHMEHHMFPMVPFHALPDLHEEIREQVPRGYSGLLEVYREIIPTLIRQSRDPGYFIRRRLPSAADESLQQKI